VSGVLVGRGVLRNPWILAQAADLAAGRAPRPVTVRERGTFLLEYIDLLLTERVDEPTGFRHVAPGVDTMPAETAPRAVRATRGHERWVINKLRALCSWYTKGLDGGSSLRVQVNSVDSVVQLRDVIGQFFLMSCQDVAPDELLATGR
jgi:tRNA-dihydrouridine synthase